MLLEFGLMLECVHVRFNFYTKLGIYNSFQLTILSLFVYKQSVYAMRNKDNSITNQPNDRKYQQALNMHDTVLYTGQTYGYYID